MTKRELTISQALTAFNRKWRRLAINKGNVLARKIFLKTLYGLLIYRIRYIDNKC